jgi:hypothetical protein
MELWGRISVTGRNGSTCLPYSEFRPRSIYTVGSFCFVMDFITNLYINKDFGFISQNPEHWPQIQNYVVSIQDGVVRRECRFAVIEFMVIVLQGYSDDVGE